MIPKITSSFTFCRWKGLPEPLSGSQGGPFKTRAPGEESGADSGYLEEQSASMLDCARLTPHNIWGSFFRTQSEIPFA